MDQRASGSSRSARNETQNGGLIADELQVRLWGSPNRENMTGIGERSKEGVKKTRRKRTGLSNLEAAKLPRHCGDHVPLAMVIHYPLLISSNNTYLGI